MRFEMIFESEDHAACQLALMFAPLKKAFGREEMIRKATIKDIPGIILLQESIESENIVWGYKADTKEDWEKRNLAWTLVAIEKDSIIGFIHCTPRPYDGECIFPKDCNILEIVDLLIHQSNRSRGLGHQMIKMIKAQAIQDGFTYLRVYSAAKRFEDIVKFYMDCGFTPWYLEMTQEIGSEPAS